MKSHLKNLEIKLRKIPSASKHDPALLARYIGSQKHEKRAPDEQSQLLFLGLTMPQQRDIFKKLNTMTAPKKKTQLDFEWDYWTYVFKTSKIYEVKSIALFWLERKDVRASAFEHWGQLKTWVAHIDNWAHSDGLSNIYAAVLENHPRLISDFKIWNKSKNPWERRQSIVGLLFYSRLRKKTPDLNLVLKLTEALLNDPHYFVQKAAGWTLREVYNVKPALQIKFVKKNLGRITSTAWFATSEKYGPGIKKILLAKRKFARQERTT